MKAKGMTMRNEDLISITLWEDLLVVTMTAPKVKYARATTIIQSAIRGRLWLLQTTPASVKDGLTASK